MEYAYTGITIDTKATTGEYSGLGYYNIIPQYWTYSYQIPNKAYDISKLLVDKKIVKVKDVDEFIKLVETLKPVV